MLSPELRKLGCGARAGSQYRDLFYQGVLLCDRRNGYFLMSLEVQSEGDPSMVARIMEYIARGCRRSSPSCSTSRIQVLHIAQH